MRRYIIAIMLLIGIVIVSSLCLSEAADISLEKDLLRCFAQSRVIIKKIEEKLIEGSPVSGELERLKTLAEDIRMTHLLLKERFRLRQKRINSLGPKAIERHSAMSEGYEEALEDYLRIMEGLAHDEDLTQATLDILKSIIERILPQKKRPIFGSLPYRRLNYGASEPLTDPAIVPAYNGVNTEVSTDDLKSTPEAPISKEIADFAKSLNWNPVLIYEWVKNNIETEWYWGCMKGAEETLRQRSGNDCDQATLLIALFRASGFPGRYVRGVIEFFPDIEKAKNLTGVEDEKQMASFFQKAGIPYKPVIAGGRISDFKIEHIWVESRIPNANYRGTMIDEHGKTWLALDTSLKAEEYIYSAPEDILKEISLSDIRGDYISAVQDKTPLEFLRMQIESYLGQNHPDITYEDLLRKRTPVPEEIKILPAGLQFRQICITHEYTEIPNELMHKARFIATTPLGGPIFDITCEAHTLSNRSIAITYEPETVEDQEIMNSYGGMSNTPSYLVRLRPVLTVNGERLAVGTEGLPIGGEYTLTIELISPNGIEQFSNTHIIGNLSVMGIVAQRAVPPGAVPDEEKDAERILHEEAIRYINRWNHAEGELSSLLHLTITRPVFTLVTMGGVVDVTYLLGVPHGFEWKGIYIDADLRAIEMVGGLDLPDQAEIRRTFMQLSSLQGSILENRVIEDDLKVESISTAKLFGLANMGQIPILTIDHANIDSLLPALDMAENIKEDIANAVNQRLTVKIPRQEITFEDWTGVGYIKEDPETGESGWMLSGMIAGGMTAWGGERWPEYEGNRLKYPFSEPPNYDPESARYIQKITATDMQKGTVGELLEEPLQVIVLDDEMRPVEGVEVTFTIKAGGGTFSNGETTITVVTDSEGIASAVLILGKETSANPTMWWESDYTYAQQVGENIVDASLPAGTHITAPFTAFGFPGEPSQMRKTYGDENWGWMLGFAGFISVIIEDEYGNPISNLPVDFQAQTPINQYDPSHINYHDNPDPNPALLLHEDDPCVQSIPSWGQCGSESIQAITGHKGALVYVILGGFSDGKYPILATYGDLTETFYLNTYTTEVLAWGRREPFNLLLIGPVNWCDEYGNLINAGKVGTSIPVMAKLEYLREKLKVREDGTTIYCPISGLAEWNIFGSEAFYIDTNFKASTVTFSGQIGTPKGNGLYIAMYSLEPGINTITIDGTATIRIIKSCENGHIVYEDLTQDASTIMEVFGVDIQTEPEIIIATDENGYLVCDAQIKYIIEPSEYKATSAYVVIFKDSDPIAYIPAETQGQGSATISRGFKFDLESNYEVEVVLNLGTEVEIRSDKKRIVQLELQAKSPVRLETHVDRINGEVCTYYENLEFSLSHRAEVTIKVDEEVIKENSVLDSGDHTVPIPEEMIMNEIYPGEHDFEITAVLTENPEIKTIKKGKIIHDLKIYEAFPIGHTMIKGVDIWDGHLTHTTQDIFIPGRGLSLDFTRSYSSAGNSSDGPMGAGWTHSYNIRLVKDRCGRYVVIGGEGTGNAFIEKAIGVFQPQIGYHSTLVQVDGNRFDFFTKAHIRYHFEREEFLPGEVYTLRFIEEPNGNMITLDYLSGDNEGTTLDHVIDSSGRALVFEYDFIFGQKRIVKITGRNNLTGSDLGLEVTYNYDEHGNLIRVTRKGTSEYLNNDERVQEYHYSNRDPNPIDLHNLRFYTNPNRHKTEYVYYEPEDTTLNAYIFSIPEHEPVTVPKHELIKSVKEPEGVTTAFTYDFENNKREVTDPRPEVPPTKYTLNNYGATVQIDAPLDKITIMEWATDTPSDATPDRDGNPSLDALMIKKIDAEGRTHYYKYDYLGNLIKETIDFTNINNPNITPYIICIDESGQEKRVDSVSTEYTYETTFSKVTGKTDAEGNKTVYLIDSDYPEREDFCPDPTPDENTGDLLGIKDAKDNFTCYDYYEKEGDYYKKGDLKSVTDPRGFVTLYKRYDLYGNPVEIIKIVDPIDNVTTNIYDERSRLIETKDTFGHYITYEYDGLDRKIMEKRFEDSNETGIPQTTKYLYKPNGELKSITDGLGQMTEYVYDDLDRRILKIERDVLQAEGSTIDLETQYFYDKGSNLGHEIDPREIEREHSYDELNRRIMTEIVKGPSSTSVGMNNVVMEYAYDLVDNKLSETDLHGYTTTYFYDGLYRVVETHLPFTHEFTDVPSKNTAIIKTTFNRVGNKVRETDANGNPTTYVYDEIYRLISKTDAVGNIIEYDYDRAGNKIRETNLSSGLVKEWTNPDYDGLNRPKVMRLIVPLCEPGCPENTVYKTSYDYEDEDNAVVVTNPRGFKTRTDRDSLDRIFQTVVDLDGLKLTTTYTYDGNGNVMTVMDPEGGDIDVTQEYDGLNRRIRTTYVSTPSDEKPSVTEEFIYDGNGNLVFYKDKRGIVFTWTYDNLNRQLAKVVKETITNGGKELILTEYQYEDKPDKDGLYTINESNANGNKTIKKYDSLNRITVIDDPDPNESPPATGLLVYKYDGVNKRVEIDKKGHSTKYAYDDINRLTSTKEYDSNDMLQTTMLVEFDDENNRRIETNRRGIKTIYQHDALQRLVELRRQGDGMKAHYPDYADDLDEVVLESYEYDENNNKTLFRDAVGNETRYEYDHADRLFKMTEGYGSMVEADTTYKYDNVNNLLEVKDGRTHGGDFDWKYAYDAHYRRVTARNGEGETTTYGYDENDNLTRMTEPKGEGFTTNYRYEELNKLIVVDEIPRFNVNTAAGITRFFYDGNRNKIAQQDASGNLVTYKYDALNRLTDTFQHTEAGKISDTIVRGDDPSGSNFYSATGGNEATALHWHYSHDLNNNQDLIIDAKGQQVERTYDYLDRPETKSYTKHARPGLDFQMLSILYIYDENGNVKDITEFKRVGGIEVTETTHYTYDPLDRMQTRTRRDYDAPAGKIIEYDYDIQGNRTQVIDPDGFITRYTYDERNRLKTVTTEADTPEERVTAYMWWEDNLLKKIEYPNGTVQDRSRQDAYDLADRITMIVNRPSDLALPDFSSYEYTYDENGNRVTQVETQQALNGSNPETTMYTYDNLNRLLTAEYGPGGVAGKIEYTYAPNGNRLTEQGTDPHTGQPLDRTYKYEALPGKPGTFDHVNALTQIVDNLNPGMTITYEYDRNLNQMAREKPGERTGFHFGIRDQILEADVTGNRIAFDYDHDRMRIKKINIDTGKETRYLYDETAVLLEYDGADNVFQTSLKYDYGHKLLALTQIDSNGQNRNSRFYLTDGLMSTANLTGEAGELLHSYRYDAWGHVRDQIGSSLNPRQYTGHYHDYETGLHYFGARYYDDETGRFLSQDPYLGESTIPPSLHRYLYAYANPLRFVDLRGYQSDEANLADVYPDPFREGKVIPVREEWNKYPGGGLYYRFSEGGVLEVTNRPIFIIKENEKSINIIETVLPRPKPTEKLDRDIIERYKILVNDFWKNWNEYLEGIHIPSQAELVQRRASMEEMYYWAYITKVKQFIKMAYHSDLVGIEKQMKLYEEAMKEHPKMVKQLETELETIMGNIISPFNQKESKDPKVPHFPEDLKRQYKLLKVISPEEFIKKFRDIQISPTQHTFLYHEWEGEGKYIYRYFIKYKYEYYELEYYGTLYLEKTFEFLLCIWLQKLKEANFMRILAPGARQEQQQGLNQRSRSDFGKPKHRSESQIP